MNNPVAMAMAQKANQAKGAAAAAKLRQDLVAKYKAVDLSDSTEWTEEAAKELDRENQRLFDILASGDQAGYELERSKVANRFANLSFQAKARTDERKAILGEVKPTMRRTIGRASDTFAEPDGAPRQSGTQVTGVARLTPPPTVSGLPLGLAECPRRSR